uniref:Uncharacterized protein n=1 Tax=Kwoniella bestiolae CBS 10118 TaxID=1296100 RepID=A0A1B9FV45_9TREE|nr:hypothetical protein I302_08286 [Kwoniella bestiolae CBS 10118]OCF22635.1 hypothetical protein I302_08286 [Kwoniella bestiolae CBS 10118]
MSAHSGSPTNHDTINPSPSGSRIPVPSTSSPSRPPRQLDEVVLGSPMTSPVKVFQMVNTIANGVEPIPHPRHQRQGIAETTNIEAEEGDGNTTMISILEENEVAGELLQSQDEDMNEPLDEDGHEEDEEGDGEQEEGEGSEEEEEEDDEDEDDDEEDDEEDSGDESEDLGGSPDIVAIDGPNGPPRLSLPPTVKLEPGTPGAGPSTIPTEDAAQGEGGPSAAEEGAEGETNVLVPKKKKRAKLRSPSEEEDLPPPPPPIKTIRLERAMLPAGETLEWNILDDAREKGMLGEVWSIAEDVPVENLKDENGMDIDGAPALPNGHEVLPGEAPAGPSSGPLFGLGFGDETPEEVARRLEAKYGGEDEKKSKKSKKRKPVEMYDSEDSFIDDSEALIDAPTHFARPKKEGFFVHAGLLELMEESPAKPKPKTTKAKPRSSNPAPPPKEPRKSLSAVLRSRKQRGYTFKGSQAEPISIDDSDGERNGGPSRGRHADGSLSPPPPEGDDAEDAELLAEIRPVQIDRIRYKNASRDEKYLPPWSGLPNEVRKRLWILRSESEKQNWDPNNRSKFPENLKVFLQAAGEAAYQNDIYGLGDNADKSFWHCITSALPYNEYTMRKLCTKLCYPGYFRWLHDAEDEGLRQFAEMVDKDREEVVSKYEESHKKWEEEVKEWVDDNSGPNGTPNLGSTPRLDDARPPEPPKRFGWTADMREVFAQLVEIMWHMVDLSAKASEWNIAGAKTGKEYTELAIKSRLYKRIVDLFPEGYTNTGVLSREMSKINKVKKAKQNEPEADQ